MDCHVLRECLTWQAVRYPWVPDLGDAQQIHVMGLGMSSLLLPDPANFIENIVARAPPILRNMNKWKGFGNLGEVTFSDDL